MGWAQILILKILHVFLRLKFLPALNLEKFSGFRSSTSYNGFWGERIIAAKQQGVIAWGFNPRKENKQSFAPKGRGMMANENIPRPFRAHLLILDNLGLKPQATQLNPFGGYIGPGGRCRP